MLYVTVTFLSKSFPTLLRFEVSHDFSVVAVGIGSWTETSRKSNEYVFPARHAALWAIAKLYLQRQPTFSCDTKILQVVKCQSDISCTDVLSIQTEGTKRSTGALAVGVAISSSHFEAYTSILG